MARTEVERLLEVMARLRAECPWDAQQTHRSLVTHLIEETAEVVEAIEGSGGDAHLVEELGDLLLQIVFHAEIAAREGRFDIEDVARGISDKLIRRHPHVFGEDEAPADLIGSWEARKRAEKGRTSALDGIPPLDGIARATKVISRARSHGVQLPLSPEPVSAKAVGEGILALVAAAQAGGVDADQAVRDAVRACESRIREAESSDGR